MYGPCLSAIVGVPPLSAPIRHCLGRPLPYQQADRTRADPKASSYTLYPAVSEETAGTIRYYPRFLGAILNFRARSHALLTRPPLPYAHRCARAPVGAQLPLKGACAVEALNEVKSEGAFDLHT